MDDRRLGRPRAVPPALDLRLARCHEEWKTCRHGHRLRARARQTPVSCRAPSHARCGTHRDRRIPRRASAAHVSRDAWPTSPRKRQGTRLFSGM